MKRIVIASLFLSFLVTSCMSTQASERTYEDQQAGFAGVSSKNSSTLSRWVTIEINPQSTQEFLQAVGTPDFTFAASAATIKLIGWDDSHSKNSAWDAVLDLAPHFKALRTIQVVNNKFTSLVLTSSLIPLLATQKNLESIDISDISLSLDNLKLLLTSWRHRNSLTTLNIQASTLSSEAQNELKAICPNLKELIVANAPADTLGNVIKQPTVQNISIAPQDGIKELININEQQPAISIQSKVYTNDEVVKAIRQVNVGQLSGNNFPTYLANTDIVELVLAGWKLNDGAIQAIALGLPYNTTIKTLNLYQNNFTATGVKELVSVLKGNQILETLLLGLNPNIGDAGTPFIADLIKHNTKIKYLDISTCGITDSSGETLAKALNMNKTLIELKLSNNQLRAKTWSILWALKFHPSLTNLALENNAYQGSIENIEEIINASMLKTHPLKELNLKENIIGSRTGNDTAIKIKARLSKLPNIKIEF